MNTEKIIAKMKETPIHQDEAFHTFCRHPLAPQLLREIAAGGVLIGGKALTDTFEEIYREMAVAHKEGSKERPWILELQA